jgi:hypothetical protein
MTWLQGGPFLEVSFLMMHSIDRLLFITNVLTKLKTFKPTVEIAISEKELKEMIEEFNIGYPDDVDDPNSKFYYQTQIPVFVDIAEKRKSILSLRQVSTKFIAVDFWFYGSKWDAPEWNQHGITESQLPAFKLFLDSLYDAFQFPIGTLGFENSVTDIFDTSEGWPNEVYNLERINMRSVQVENHFLYIVANKNYVDLYEIEGLKTIGPKQVLEAQT